MINSSFLKKFIFALSIVSLASCDTDYNDIGADIIDDDINHDIIRYNAGVTAYDRPTGAVQSNNMDVNLLGVLDEAAFGKTTAHFVTQLELESVNPVITENATIDSVYLYVPFLSKVGSTDSDGTRNYTLQKGSVYGNKDAKINLSVYRNGYYLRDSDPGTSEAQKYYSDDLNLVENNKGASLLHIDTDNNDDVYFSDAEVQRFADKTPDNGVANEDIVERLAPGIFKYLNKDLFQEYILEAGSANLLNNNVFKNYFRGLYFKVEQEPGQQIMGVANFDGGSITIIYTDDKFDLDGDPVDEDEDGVTDQESKKIVLNLAGNTINFFETVKSPGFEAAITSSDNVNGDENLYVKGGDGSMAFVDIDNATIDYLKNEGGGSKVLVNEANLVFYMDKNNGEEDDDSPVETYPKRVYLYDVNNNRPLFDYYADATTNTSDPKENKRLHGGIREEVTVKNAEGQDVTLIRYKVRITNHINNLVNKDSTNVRLGLVITENINNVGNAALRTPLAEEDVDKIPVSAVKQPRGIVLYGSNGAVSEEKRLKLEIFYTKPD